MSKSFESGVYSYVTGQATVKVHFPVDHKGNADICCQQCLFFRAASKRCGLNERNCEYPQKFVGSECPLEMCENTVEYDQKNVEV